MQQNYFSDKNILYLLPSNKNQYLNFICDELKKCLTNICHFNFVEYSYQYGIRNTEKYINNFISEKKIDIVFSSPFAANYQLSVEFYASLKNKTKIVFWMWDDEAYFDSHSKYYCQIADAVITSDFFSVYAYQKLNIPSIFFSTTHPQYIYFPIETTKDIDVCFIGGCNQRDRMEYINFLIDNGINVETFGEGSKNGFLSWNKFSNILSRSKIALNFNKLSDLLWMNKDELLLNRVRQSGGHWCESALTRTFCLAEYTPNIHIFAEVGKEVDIFNSKEELIEKVRYYLSHADKREVIAENAYKKAITNFIPQVIIPNILKELEKILGKNNIQKTEKVEIFLSRTFKVNSINGLTFTMFVLIKNKKVSHALELFRELFKYGIFIFFAGFYGGTVRAIKNMMMLLKTKISLKII
jgi:hypothetical protein